MNFLLKIFAAIFLLALIFVQTGCASAEEDSAYLNPSDSPPSKDDSGHGWGAAVQTPSH